MVEAKAALRHTARSHLAEIGRDVFDAAEANLCQRLWADNGPLTEAIAADAALLGYMPLDDEVSPLSAMQAWRDRGGRLSVPVTEWSSRSMRAGEVDSLDAAIFAERAHGILEPRDVRPIAASDLAVVLVPGLAFDASGGRLGRGAGFYDRFLASLSDRCLTVGVCFAAQMIDAVPHEAHDVSVQRVVTG